MDANDVKRLLERIDVLQQSDRKLVKMGAITYEEAGRRAAKIGLATGKDIFKFMKEQFPEGKITEGEALQIIPPSLRKNYTYVINLAESAQNDVNRKAGVGLSPVKPGFDEERAVGLAKYVSEKEDFTESAAEFALQVQENSRHVIDESIRTNAEAHENAGLRVTVIRRYDGVGLHDGKDTCEFCESLDGEWTYHDAQSNGVFARHPGCGCDILYESTRGNWQRQSNWRNNTWSQVDQSELERRRSYGL